MCQTSLEQIFNAFAAQQTEETGAVRGVVQLPQPPPAMVMTDYVQPVAGARSGGPLALN